MASYKYESFATDPYKPVGDDDTIYISTGIPKLDFTFNGLQSRTVTIVTGRPSEGKSTFVHNIILNAIDSNHRVLLIDGEHDRNRLWNNFMRKLIGGSPEHYTKKRVFLRDVYEPKPHINKLIHQWFGTKLQVLFKSNSDFGTFDNLFQSIETQLSLKGKHKIDMIVLDNLMSLVSSTQAEINAKQSDFMKRCKILAERYNVALVLVAHPNGTAQKGMPIDYYQISGTSDIPNLSYNIVQVIKDPLGSDGQIECDGRISVMKNRQFGEYVDIDLIYDKEMMMLCEMDNYGNPVVKKYDWQGKGKQEEWKQASNVPFN